MIEFDTQIIPTARAMSFSLFWACSAFKVRKELCVTWFSAAADYLSLLGEEGESWGSGYPGCGIGDSLPSNRFD